MAKSRTLGTGDLLSIDAGAFMFDGEQSHKLKLVEGKPKAGEYRFENGVYTFGPGSKEGEDVFAIYQLGADGALKDYCLNCGQF